MSTPEMIFERIKTLSGVSKDVDVAKELGISKGKLATAKSRGSIPWRDLFDYSTRLSVSLDWLLTGHGPMTRAGEMLADIDVIEDSIETENFGEDGIDATVDPALISGMKQKVGAIARQMPDEYVQVPLHEVEASCGGGSVVHSEQIVDYLAFKREWLVRELRLNPNKVALITAVGDSMEPRISPGDLLLLDMQVCNIAGDGIYALLLEGALYVKRVQRLFDGTVIISSENPAYEPQRFAPDSAVQLQIVGRVAWMGRMA